MYASNCRQIIGRKETAVLRERELDPVLRPEVRENLFDKARLAVLSLDDGVLEVG